VPRIGLLGTKGFLDILQIRNLRLPRLYDLAWDKPLPLVERYLRRTLDERVDTRGAIVRPLNPEEATREIDRLPAEGVEAIAVCLLNSFADPAHEQQLRDLITARAPGLPCCISSDVLPEIGEYERTSTTVVNTYVLPVVARYLATLQAHLAARGIAAPLRLMQSNGGLTTAADAAERPMNIVESGPASGVVGARQRHPPAPAPRLFRTTPRLARNQGAASSGPGHVTTRPPHHRGIRLDLRRAARVHRDPRRFRQHNSRRARPYAGERHTMSGK